MFQSRLLRLLLVVVTVWLAYFGSQVVAEDLVSFQVISESKSKQFNIPFTIGHTFKEGDIPENSGIVARLPNGEPLPLQVDKKAVHNDGSLRHAILSSHIPSLDGKATKTIVLAHGSEHLVSPGLSLSTLLNSNFDANITLKSSGQTFQISVKERLKNGNPKLWLKGSEVTEWIVGGAIKNSSGQIHPHLAVYFHVRAYTGIKRVRVDVVVENGWTFEENQKDFTYDLDVRVGADIVYSKQGLRHYSHARWHKQFWWGGKPEVYVKHDTIYLQESKAVPNYSDLIPTETYLDSLRDHTEPMDNGDHTDYMGATGAQDAIGPLPRWDATYIVSGDRRAYNSMIANSDGAGAYPSHYRDKRTGLPVSIHDHPNEYTVLTLPKVSSENPYSADKAHQPSMAFVAYLVTGDYYYLEELQFWATWNFISTNASYRLGEKGVFNQQGMQVRGIAWSLRTLGQAAYITPDDDPLKSLFIENLQHNIDYNNALYVDNPAANRLGMVQNYDGLRLAAPWMDDFFTFAYGYLVDLGFDEAIKMRDWKAKYVINRLGRENRKGGFCWQFSAFYRTYQGPYDLDKSNPENWYKNFDEYWEGNWGYKKSNGKYLRDVACDSNEMAEWMGRGFLKSQMSKSSASHAADSYYSNMQPAVAVAVDAGLDGAELARFRFYEKTPVRPDYNDKPQWAVEPRTSDRVPRIIFSANPAVVRPGGAFTLSWSAMNAENCAASGGWSGSKAVSGSEIIQVDYTNKYMITCDGIEGRKSKQVTVAVKSDGEKESGQQVISPDSALPEIGNSASSGGGAMGLYGFFAMLVALLFFKR